MSRPLPAGERVRPRFLPVRGEGLPISPSFPLPFVPWGLPLFAVVGTARPEAPRPGPSPGGGRPGLGSVGPDVLLFLARPAVGAERCQVAAVGAASGRGEDEAPSRKPPLPAGQGRRIARAVRP